MENWDNKKCGNCGFSATKEAVLPKYHCPECGRDMCPHCSGGNALSPMCKDCAFEKLKISRGKPSYTVPAQ